MRHLSRNILLTEEGARGALDSATITSPLAGGAVQQAGDVGEPVELRAAGAAALAVHHGRRHVGAGALAGRLPLATEACLSPARPFRARGAAGSPTALVPLRGLLAS